MYEFFDELDFDKASLQDFSQVFITLVDDVIYALDTYETSYNEQTLESAREETHRIKGTLSYMGYDLSKLDLEWESLMFKALVSSKYASTQNLKAQLFSIKQDFIREVKVRVAKLSLS